MVTSPGGQRRLVERRALDHRAPVRLLGDQSRERVSHGGGPSRRPGRNSSRSSGKCCALTHGWRAGSSLGGRALATLARRSQERTGRAASGSWGVAGRGRLPAERLLTCPVGEQAPPTLPLTRSRRGRAAALRRPGLLALRARPSRGRYRRPGRPSGGRRTSRGAPEHVRPPGIGQQRGLLERGVQPGAELLGVRLGQQAPVHRRLEVVHAVVAVVQGQEVEQPPGEVARVVRPGGPRRSRRATG